MVRFFTPLRLFGILVVGLATSGWQRWSFPAMLFAELSQNSQRELVSGALYHVPESQSFVHRLNRAALDRAGRVVRYDPRYKKIPFPMGDIPADRGCSTDEIIRAYRAAGVDLQEQIYLDMVRSFGAYPHRKDQYQPDTNMDHRVIANLRTFFRRNGVTLPPSRQMSDYEAGDILFCHLRDGSDHIAMVVPGPLPGSLWIVHNMGYGPRLEDRLLDFPITGHFRYHPLP